LPDHSIEGSAHLGVNKSPSFYTKNLLRDSALKNRAQILAESRAAGDFDR
jgi:hypothetical protein